MLNGSSLEFVYGLTDLHENNCSDGTAARIFFHTVDSQAKQLNLDFKNSKNSSFQMSTDSATKNSTNSVTHQF